MRRLRLVAAALVLAVAGMGVALVTSTPAYANAGNNWCIGNGPDCMNAWNGGPWVKFYTGGTTANGDFIWDHGLSLPAQYMVFANYSSPWANRCIGDANNDAGDARASLDACPGTSGGSGSGDGWGTHVLRDTASCANGYVAFKDLHWNGWLGPADSSNGSQMYLNKQTPYCYQSYPAQ